MTMVAIYMKEDNFAQANDPSSLDTLDKCDLATRGNVREITCLTEQHVI